VASIQWALNALETTELAKPYLAQWEADREKNGPAAVPARANGGNRGGGNRGGAGRGRAGGGGGRGNRGAPAP
jgi:hypothetical protein